MSEFKGQAGWSPSGLWNIGPKQSTILARSNFSSTIATVEDDAQTVLNSAMLENGDIEMPKNGYFELSSFYDIGDWNYSGEMNIKFQYIPKNPAAISPQYYLGSINLSSSIESGGFTQRLTVYKGDLIRTTITTSQALSANVIDFPQSNTIFLDVSDDTGTQYRYGLAGEVSTYANNNNLHVMQVAKVGVNGLCTFILTQDGTPNGSPLFDAFANVNVTVQSAYDSTPLNKCAIITLNRFPEDKKTITGMVVTVGGLPADNTYRVSALIDGIPFTNTLT